jgi:hypothetical protein
MANGESRGQVDEKFTKRINDLEDIAQKMSEQFKDWQHFRPWHTPKELVDAERDLLDVPSLHTPCWDRNSINQLYSEKILAGPGKEGGTTGDLIAMKWQADFMATEERAFRLRHASLPRCAALMHGRLDGHGQKKISVFSSFAGSVKTSIDTGRAHAKPPTSKDAFKGDINSTAAAGLA